MNRMKLIDHADALYNYIDTKYSNEEEAWRILKRFGANDDDSDPYEGYFDSMSTSDIARAIDALEDRFFGPEVNVKLREKEISFLIDALSHYPARGNEATMIELLIDKLNQ